MPNDDPERLLRIIVLFSQQFKKTQFNDHLKREFGFDDVVRVRFTMEHEDFELPRRLDDLLRSLVSQDELDPSDRGLREFCRLVQMYRNFFGCTGQESRTDDNLRITQRYLDQISQELVAE